MGLLHIFFCIFLYVLRQTFLYKFLKLFNSLSARVADSHLCVFSLRLTLLSQLATTLLGKRRHGQTDNLAVVRRGKTDVRVDNGFLYLADELLFPRLNSDGACIGHKYCSYRTERRLCAVIIDTDHVEEFRTCLARTNMRECLIKVSDGVLHLLFGSCFIQTEFFFHGDMLNNEY